MKGLCNVEWVSETAGGQGTNYSARLRCSGTAENARQTISNLVLVPKGANQILVGADFKSLKTYQRCPADEPVPPRSDVPQMQHANARLVDNSVGHLGFPILVRNA